MIEIIQSLLFVFLLSGCLESTSDNQNSDEIKSGYSYCLDGEITLEITLNKTKGTVTGIMKGPKDKWFGIGFGETTMSNQPWTIISDGNGIITERKLGSYSPGQLLNPTITIVINEVNGEFRNIEFKRSLIINDQDYFSFDFDAEFIDFICAFGNSTQFQYHGPNTNDNINHTAAKLSLYYKN